MEDNFAREKIMKFNNKRILERVVHTRGTRTFGTFTLYKGAKDVTNASVLTNTS